MGANHQIKRIKKKQVLHNSYILSYTTSCSRHKVIVDQTPIFENHPNMLSFVKQRPPIVASASHHSAASFRQYHSLFFLLWRILYRLSTQINPTVRPLNAFGISVSPLRTKKRYKWEKGQGMVLGKMTDTWSQSNLCCLGRPSYHPYLLSIVIVLLVALGTSFLFGRLVNVFGMFASFAIFERWAVGEIATFLTGFCDLARPMSAFWVS